MHSSYNGKCGYFIKQIDPMSIIDNDDWSLPNERLDVSYYCSNF